MKDKTTPHQLIPYGRQTISEEDIESVIKVLRSPMITQGPAVQAFENEVKSLIGVNHSVATNSATSALHIACKALGLAPGDRLWTTPTTFVASANCGRYCGADIDFVDINPDNGLMCMEKLKIKLKEADNKGLLPKVVVPVHLAGTSCDMKMIGNLAQEYGFSILEDASHAIGGNYLGEPVGNCKYSKISIYSFHPVKIITSAEGGMATTNDSKCAQIMNDLRSHGITKDHNRFKFSEHDSWMYEQQNLGFNFRMNDIQAALGLSQLKRLEKILSERNSLLKIYKKLLNEIPVDFLEIPKGVISSVHLAIIKLRTASKSKYRKVFNGLRKAGIGVQLHYIPVHLQPYYRNLGFKNGDFPNAEAYARSAISLPLYPGLKSSEQEYVVSKVAQLVMNLSKD